MNTIDPRREMAAEFKAYADKHAAHIMTSDLYTERLVNALANAEHMIRGGSYSGSEATTVFVQFNKLKRHFGDM
jgi:hypothetical protein